MTHRAHRTLTLALAAATTSASLVAGATATAHAVSTPVSGQQVTSGAGPAAAPAQTRAHRPVRATFRRGRVTVVGTSKKDRIKVLRTSDGITVRAGRQVVVVSPRPQLSAVKSVRVRARGGDDVVKIVERSGQFAQVSIQGGGDADRLVGGKGVSGLFGRSGNDTLVSGGGRTFMDGGDGDDTLVGGGGANTMHGAAGKDTILGGAGANSMLGEGDDDTMVGGAGVNRMAGGDNNDTMTGGAGRNEMNGGANDDTMTSGLGASRLFGGTDADRLFGGATAATLVGGPGDDYLRGGPAGDAVLGDSGNDTLAQSGGGDSLTGAEGDDLYLLDADVAGGTTQVIEAAGGGIDTVSLAATTTVPVSVDLSSGAVQTLSGNLAVRLSASGAENVVGGALDDVLTGSQAVNRFTGGAGADVFQHHGPGDGVDTVADLNLAEGDRIGFLTSSVEVQPSQLELDSTATRLRDAATGTFGFTFGRAARNADTYLYGRTPAGVLVSHSGTGAFALPAGTGDSLLTNFASSGAVLTGGDAKDHIVDLSPNGNVLVGGLGNDVLEGRAGADTFRYVGGQAPFGADVITDFVDGVDTVDLDGSMLVSGGIGTTTVTITDFGAPVGTITAGNGHNWQVGDFS